MLSEYINTDESRPRQALNSGFNVWTVRMWRGKYVHTSFLLDITV